MRIRDIVEASLDWPDDVDFDTNPVSQRQYLSPEQERFKKRHQARQDPNRRQKNLDRIEREANADEDHGREHWSRHVPKSLINYKPYKTPLIRFGKFRAQSKIGFSDNDNEEILDLRREEGLPSHEDGISCYAGYPMHDGYLLIEPDRNRATHGGGGHYYPVPHMGAQFIAYLDQGTPMDIFLIRGHLVGTGGGRYLSLGSDGEFLLDVKKPYRMMRWSPERVYVGNGSMNIIQWFDQYVGIGKARERLETEQLENI